MKLLKPSWVNHDDQPIFSIDVHPDSSRFATGGQGQDSGKIIIWNMRPIIDKEKEFDTNEPKILCQMDHHISCVNVVRWSNNGNFLASGSDDKLIMIWQYVHGGNGYNNIENWKCGFTLRSHSGDVLDLAWSSKDQYLASCSVDNTVIIWNALKFPDIITRINAHSGLVKGVAWDPVGTYLSSQSDDKTLKVWKTLDWSLEKCFEEPFKNCTGTTHILRLNWSPDGQLLISAHALNNGAPTAQVIDRGNKWSTKLDFVGHRKAVTAVRFFPQILKADNSAFAKTHCLCALGSRDRSISIWLTNYTRPLTVLHDLFDNPIMDLSWAKLPMPGLMACSMDGTVSYIQFKYQEIGYPLTKQETEEFFMKKYNYNITEPIDPKSNQLTSNINLNNKKETNEINFIENIDILLAQEKKQNEEQQIANGKQTSFLRIDENSNTNINNSINSQSKSDFQSEENQKQIERKLPDGRRRITPICISKPGEYDSPKPFGAVSSDFNKIGFTSSIGFGMTSQTATQQSTIIVEKRDEKNEIVEISPVKSIVYQKANTSNTNSVDMVAYDKQTKQPTTSDNIQPASTALQTTHFSSKPVTEKAQTTENKTAPTTEHPQSTVRKQLIKDVPSAPTSNNNNIGNTAKAAQKTVQPAKAQETKSSANIQQQNNKSKPQSNQNNLQTTKSSTSLTTNTTDKNKADNTATSTAVNQMESSFSTRNVIHESRVQKLKALSIENNKLSFEIKSNVLLEVNNAISLVEKQPVSSLSSNDHDVHISSLRLLNNKQLKWQIYVYSRVSHLIFNNEIICFACDDCTLNFVKLINGTQLCCPILLDSRASVLKSNRNYFLCLTEDYCVYAWKYNNDEQANNPGNLQTLTTLINRQSCAFLFKDNGFLDAQITNEGVVILRSSKNRSYFFSTQTSCWHLLPLFGSVSGKESHLLMNVNSIFNRTSFNSIANCSLSKIQSSQNNLCFVKTIELMNKTNNELLNKNDFTLTHLESQLNASIGLNSPKEFKFWLMTYARYVVENNYQEKLTELCNFLLGPLYSLNWNQMIFSYKKRDLLREILSIMAQNVQLQRLYSYFKQQMSVVDNIGSKNSVMDRLITSNNRTITLNKDKELGLQQKLTSNSNMNLNLNINNEINEMDVETISSKTNFMLSSKDTNNADSKNEFPEMNVLIEEKKDMANTESLAENQNRTVNEEAIEIEMVSAENKEEDEQKIDLEAAPGPLSNNIQEKLTSDHSNESENQPSTINDLIAIS